MKKNSTISGHLQVNGHALDIEYVERDVVVVTIDGVAVEFLVLMPVRACEADTLRIT